MQFPEVFFEFILSPYYWAPLLVLWCGALSPLVVPKALAEKTMALVAFGDYRMQGGVLTWTDAAHTQLWLGIVPGVNAIAATIFLGYVLSSIFGKGLKAKLREVMEKRLKK